MSEFNKQPPPAYGFQPLPEAPPAGQPQVIYTTVNAAMSLPVGPESTRITCPSCHASVSTRTEKESTSKTHLFALVLCLLTGLCCCIPYCCDLCKATNHYCPSCGAYLGTYDR